MIDIQFQGRIVMIDIKNLTIALKIDGRILLEGFNFTLHEGDKAVIIGEEGNGKSTLLRLLYDERMIERYCEYTGQIIRGNIKIGYLEQETPTEWNRWPVCDLFREIDSQSLYETAAKLRLAPSLFESEQKIATLSGGEKVKLRLAKLLQEHPDVLLLDEPTNDLDIKTLTWLEEFIAASTLPILYISHDETLIERTANTVIHIEQRKRKTQPVYTVARMGYAEYVESRNRALLKQEQVSRKQHAEYESQMQRWQQIYNKVEHQQNIITRADPGGGRLLKKKIKALKSQERRIQKSAQDFAEIPDVEEAINFSFINPAELPNGKRVLDFEMPALAVNGRLLAQNVRLSITGPEHVAITGDNGTGKSTLIRELYMVLSERRDLRVGYMPQNYTDTMDDLLTPVDFLAQSGEKGERTKAYTFLGSMKYTAEEMTRPIKTLSGGQKAKLMLLSLIFGGYSVLLLDEPTRNLSPLSNPIVREAFAACRCAMISVTHDRKFIEQVCTTVYELRSDGLVRLS